MKDVVTFYLKLDQQQKLKALFEAAEAAAQSGKQGVIIGQTLEGGKVQFQFLDHETAERIIKAWDPEYYEAGHHLRGGNEVKEK